MIPTIVAIPTIGASPLLPALVKTLSAEAEVWVYANAGADEEVISRLHVPVIRPDNNSIYGRWNDALRTARALGSANLAILNDDLEVAPGTLGAMAEHLRATSGVGLVSVDPGAPLGFPARSSTRDTTGTYRLGGIAGWCFMVRAETCPLIDEQYEVWYGDDFLVAELCDGGQRCVVIEGLGVRHEMSTTLNREGWTVEARERDAKRWAETGRP